MANQLFQGYLYTDAGVAINGATVNLYDRNTTTPVRATTTTDANGLWTISHATEGRFDVEIVNGSSIRRRKYDTQEQIDTLEVANLRIRNPADTFDFDIVPAAIVADRQLNLPLLTGTDTLVVLALAQTLTNKTLTSPTIQGTVGAGTGLTLPAFTAGGNITLGANSLLTTNLLLKETDATTLAVRNAADTLYRDLVLDSIRFQGSVTLDADGGKVDTSNADGFYGIVRARDSGVGLVEIARFQGAAEPYFGIGLDGEGIGIRTVKVTKAFNSTLFNAAATTDDDDVWAQPAGSVLLAVKIKMTGQFAAAGMTDLDITMGLAGDVDGLLVQAMNLTSDAVNSEYTTRGAYWNEAAALGFLAKDAATTWRAYATAVGANLSTLSGGTVEFYFTYLDIP